MSQVCVDICVVLCFVDRVTGGELFDEIVAREFYSEHDARCVYTYQYTVSGVFFTSIVNVVIILW